jgi:hypothetical protein
MSIVMASVASLRFPKMIWNLSGSYTSAVALGFGGSETETCITSCGGTQTISSAHRNCAIREEFGTEKRRRILYGHCLAIRDPCAAWRLNKGGSPDGWGWFFAAVMVAQGVAASHPVN